MKEIKSIEIIIVVDNHFSRWTSACISKREWKQRAEDMLEQIKRHVDFGKVAHIKTTYYEEEE